MQYYYQLKFSKTQSIVLLLAYFTAVAMSLFYLSQPWLKWSCVAGLAISAYLEYRHLIQKGNLQLRIVPQRQIVELTQHQQPYIFRKNKVYETRWFAILKVTDRHINRTLILNPDCFESLECYRQCRLQLRRLGNPDAA